RRQGAQGGPPAGHRQLLQLPRGGGRQDLPAQRERHNVRRPGRARRDGAVHERLRGGRLRDARHRRRAHLPANRRPSVLLRGGADQVSFVEARPPAWAVLRRRTMTPRTLRVTLNGTGFAADYTAACYGLIPHKNGVTVELVGVTSGRPERAAAFARS